MFSSKSVIIVASAANRVKRSSNCSSSSVSSLLSRTAAAAMAASSSSRPSSDMAAFRRVLAGASRVVVLTGAGVSAESGVPTFRGAGGLWRRHPAQSLATPEAFEDDPSLVWEFYHYRRELVRAAEPNAAHRALADLQRAVEARPGGASFTLVTQNVDGLHARAGNRDVVELHGSLFRVRCPRCGDSDNKDSPVCEALRGRGAPDVTSEERIPVENLPRCLNAGCGRLLRPAVVWFGEALDPDVLARADAAVRECDVCLVVGTSSVVYPAAMFAPAVARRGGVVAEFNLESTGDTGRFAYHFAGPCGQTLPEAIRPPTPE